MKTISIMLPLGIALSATLAGAQEGDRLSREELAAKLNGVDPADITESPIVGLFQVEVGSTVAYVTGDGRYLIQGDVYDLDTRENVTEETRAQARSELLGSVERDEMIVFSPPSGDVRHTVTIFTDIDCGYCRQFHREIEQVNALGIEVRYLFYPRTGPDTESWAKADKVWCAEDRNTALTRAKLGGAVPDNNCDATPVGEHFELGQQVGVRGTPTIFAGNGELIGGYVPADVLAEQLDALAQ